MTNEEVTEDGNQWLNTLNSLHDEIRQSGLKKRVSIEVDGRECYLKYEPVVLGKLKEAQDILIFNTPSAPDTPIEDEYVDEEDYDIDEN